MDHRVLKENDIFILTDRDGNIPLRTRSELGLYTKDTRFLSQYQFELEGIDLILLSSEADQNYVGTIRLSNRAVREGEEIKVWMDSLGITRTRFLYQDVFYEQITIKNYNTYEIPIQPSFTLDGDFKHMFAVRSFLQGSIGQKAETSYTESSLTIPYNGSDGIKRSTEVVFDPKPSELANGKASFQLTLPAAGEIKLHVSIIPWHDQERPTISTYEKALLELKNSYAGWMSESAKVQSDSESFNEIYHRSLLDMRCLLNDLGEGRFPVAGTPWFAVPFGRDSIIAAIQSLLINPELAKGTLKTLAKYQGQAVDPWRDEEPGKILHEIRFGELANNNDIPHTPYYGSIDATPLFLVLAVEYYRWTGNMELMESLRPNIEKALAWIDEYGDVDKDGYVEYVRKSSKGIANQGWKDSGDSVIHRNGDFAEAPIALAEVQGYVYDAKLKLSSLFEEWGEATRAAALREQANQLKERFAQDFWLEKESFPAIALDGHKKQVESVTSNPGHCLWSDFITEEQKGLVVQRLVSSDMFTGFGIRTMSTTSTRYNPMSYHDGSVWPHDNSLVFLGMKRQGYDEEAMAVVQSLLDAAKHFEYQRLPELYCGFSREEAKIPVEYPVACSPQAWAAGTALLMVQSMLGLEPNVSKGIVKLAPSLPTSLNEILVSDIQIGKGTIDVCLTRNSDGIVGVRVLHNSTGLTVML